MKVPQVRSEDNWCAILYNWVTVPETSQNNGSWELMQGIFIGILGGGVLPSVPNPDPISDRNRPFSTPVFRPGARFSKLPVITGPVKLFCFPFQMRVSKLLKINSKVFS